MKFSYLRFRPGHRFVGLSFSLSPLRTGGRLELGLWWVGYALEASP